MSNLTTALRLTRLVTDYGQACESVTSLAYFGSPVARQNLAQAESKRDELHAQIEALLTEIGRA